MDKRQPSLEEVFHPRGVAVVGASASGKFSFGTGVTISLKAAGFPAIYPVNPKYTEVLGLKCYASILDIPGTVDHVIVSIPAESVLALLDDCAAKGVKSVQFFTAGFSESGRREGAELEREILARARAGGFRIIGPNCVGLFVPSSRLVNTGGVPLEAGPIAFISQSGGHAQNLPAYGSPRGLRFSKIVSYGNGLDVDEAELLEYFSEDAETEIIAAYIEGVKDGRHFMEALREAAARKPVVIYKGGVTEAGKRAAHGHTASLTSSVAVFDAMCRQMKTIQVEDMQELMNVLVVLRFGGAIPRGTGVALVGAGGGPSVLASDEIERAGLQLPYFAEEVRVELQRFLPLAGSIFVNPVDAPNLALPEAIAATMSVVSKVADVDMIVYHLGFHPISRWGGGRFASADFLKPTIEAIKQVQEASGKPVLLALFPPPDLEGMKDFLAVQEAFVGAGLAVFHSLREVARAMAKVIAWKQS